MPKTPALLLSNCLWRDLIEVRHILVHFNVLNSLRESVPKSRPDGPPEIVERHRKIVVPYIGHAAPYVRDVALTRRRIHDRLDINAEITQNENKYYENYDPLNHI